LSKYRYLIDFDTSEFECVYHDVVIIGSGIAGVYTALQIPEKYDVAILTKETIDISNSVLAQGGIAVSLGKEDSPQLHFKDTLYAGAGLCDEQSVWVLVNEAAQNIERLCKLGVNFDRESAEELSLTREGAHSKNRIIHAGDATGKEVCDKLIAVVKTRSNIRIKERTFAVDLLTEDNKCKGVLVYDEDSSKFKVYLSNAVVCATGGYGQIYKYTTNPEVATGDGVCIAYRAGAELSDLEFVQFHPTVLYHPENKSFLISEAVRGEGAILRNINGKRFMPEYHELNELAPRDVVSRAIFKEMQKTGSTHVYLDITFKSKQFLENRFPNIYKTCLQYGIDMSKDYIPVAPAAHYSMGGIKVNIDGETAIEGLYACGESASNGIHGANRLASNSLLEGLVFGYRTAQHIGSKLEDAGLRKVDFSLSYKTNRSKKNIDIDSMKTYIKNVMTANVGIIRHKDGLTEAAEKMQEFYDMTKDMKLETMKEFELMNMITLSRLVIDSALKREESRGAHYRSDFDKPSEEWKKHIIHKIDNSTEK